MCTAICAGSPATTSFAESLNPASVHLSKTSSGYSVLEASAMSENASDEVSATAASSAEEFLSEESPADFSTPGRHMKILLMQLPKVLLTLLRKLSRMLLRKVPLTLFQKVPPQKKT